LSDDEKAGQRVQSIFMARILATEGIQVVSPGETYKGILEQYIDLQGDPTPGQIVELGKRLSVQGIFFGTIEDYGTDRLSNNRSHIVTASFRLAETETGSVVWNAQVHAGGTSLFRKLFGGQAPTMFAVSSEVVDEALGTLF
jgi:hypothetical protein